MKSSGNCMAGRQVDGLFRAKEIALNKFAPNVGHEIECEEMNNCIILHKFDSLTKADLVY